MDVRRRRARPVQTQVPLVDYLFAPLASLAAWLSTLLQAVVSTFTFPTDLVVEGGRLESALDGARHVVTQRIEEAERLLGVRVDLVVRARALETTRRRDKVSVPNSPTLD